MLRKLELRIKRFIGRLSERMHGELPLNLQSKLRRRGDIFGKICRIFGPQHEGDLVTLLVHVPQLHSRVPVHDYRIR